jgi:hypothetical protein
MTRLRALLLLCFAIFSVAAPALAADKRMTSAQMNSLFSYVRIVKLGGPSSGYNGMLYLNPNGTGSGLVFFDDGTSKTITGTWFVSGNNQFCRTWAEFDGGLQVCEKWVFITDNSVRVLVGSTEIGVNSW